MEVKIELTIDNITKEEFNLVVFDDKSINDLLWEVRLTIKESLERVSK